MDKQELITNEKYLSFYSHLYDSVPCAIIQYALKFPPEAVSYNKATWEVLEYPDKKTFDIDVEKNFLSFI